MSFLLDTDICSAYLKGERRVFNRFVQYSGGLHISTVAMSELYTWAFRATGSGRRLSILEDMLSQVNVLPVDSTIAQMCGRIRASLLDAGLKIATADMVIAATALVHDMSMVTHNVQHFRNVPGIHLVDWLSP